MRFADTNLHAAVLITANLASAVLTSFNQAKLHEFRMCACTKGFVTCVFCFARGEKGKRSSGILAQESCKFIGHETDHSLRGCPEECFEGTAIKKGSWQVAGGYRRFMQIRGKQDYSTKNGEWLEQ